MSKEIPQTMPVSPAAINPTKTPAGALLKSLKSWKLREREFDMFEKSPVLRFSPTAWAKLLFLRDYGDTEVGGFGIASAADLLFVEDVALVRQISTGVSVTLLMTICGRLFRPASGRRGRTVQQFARIWLHTHPGTAPSPA